MLVSNTAAASKQRLCAVSSDHHAVTCSPPASTAHLPQAAMTHAFYLTNLACACQHLASGLHELAINQQQTCMNIAHPRGNSRAVAVPVIPVPARLMRTCRTAKKWLAQNGTAAAAARPPVLALAAFLSAAALPSQGLTDLRSNAVLMTGFWAWLLAQTLKIFTKRFRKGVWDVMALFDSGGMPSSHSALCMGVTTAVALEYGLSSPLFAVCLCFSCIVMYDAAGVRRHAGMQAEVLNVLVGDLLEGHPISEKKLKEVLGHTPLQVCCGASLGVLIGLLHRPMLA